MITKVVKRTVIGLVVLGVVGGFFLGSDLFSYVSSSAKHVRSTVKDAVPVEFELRRARDLLEQILPEMHANIELIAREEVEVAALEAEIEVNEDSLAVEQARIAKLRSTLDSHYASYQIGRQRYTHQELVDDLNRRFERFKQAKLVLDGKRTLLNTREKSLVSAKQHLENTRSQKKLLEVKIEGLESQYHLVKAAAAGSGIELDNSKLAQTEKLIHQIKKRLDVAERILAHESRFVQPIEFEDPTISESDLIEQIDEYFHRANEPVKIVAETDDGDPKR